VARRDANDRYFQLVMDRISIEPHLEMERAKAVMQIMRKTERAKIAKELNMAYADFHIKFIQSFIGSGADPFIFSSMDNMGFYEGQSLSQMGVSYKRLSRKWENKKRSLGLGTPEFFNFKNQMPETFGPPDVKNLSKSKLPKKTLKQYITQHWENIIKRKIGVFTADDIVVLNSKGQELRLTKGFISYATEAAKRWETHSARRGLDRADIAARDAYLDRVTKELKSSPFTRLKTASSSVVFNLKSKSHSESVLYETFSFGFRPLRSIQYRKLLTNRYQVELSTQFISVADNTAPMGYPLSKLTNNHTGAKGTNRAIRPTLGPLLHWYHKVKLPKVFRTSIGGRGVTPY